MLKTFYKKVKNPKFEKHGCQILLPWEHQVSQPKQLVLKKCFMPSPHVVRNKPLSAAFPEFCLLGNNKTTQKLH